MAQIHIKDDFGKGPVSQVPASWYNSVAKFINNLIGGEGVTVDKHDDGAASVIDIDTSALPIPSPDPGTPSSSGGSFPTDEITQTAGDIWTSGGANGILLPVIFNCVSYGSGNGHDFYVCNLTFSKDGLLTKVERIANCGTAINA